MRQLDKGNQPLLRIKRTDYTYEAGGISRGPFTTFHSVALVPAYKNISHTCERRN